ncbi:hypothetical protein MCOR27_004028 [Pyricularia oryzae]|uniref:GPI transamidase component GAA1 n=4 Tax=Pyricularia TaxID=48558 RepID=A0ABQ8NLY2_PYRGI|nr:GPI transamidase component GAA1 [Pyricularia oryzae 70-15]ELQ36123.1 GPI transamidase component GAA1 [Pyricularia oryzae Y34]KAH9431696.1 hypothetical protein MCOR02_008984 [Pyricularia oryzae]KAI6298648.1 hypothetical protein MCOR33_005294 [Pyricularia grisea]EHA50077.1 GPI transamidase component GAA1 [Pyricularia oryzae 70-15]KAI6258015.1 hypothetical protein MCOR19_005600 [Pyricularia oryzae]
MPRLLSTVLSLRRDPRILKLPPYLSVLCIVVGIVSLLLLPLDNFTRRTYISENALLPGQVHTYFAGSDQNVFRAYKHEVNSLVDKSNVEINDKLESIFKGVGLKVGRQNFTYSSSGIQHSGENVYAILQAPRGDATEAIVLVTAWRNPNGELNRNGVALALTLARYFRRWSLWSKDIIFLLPPDSLAGPQAWVDAYHDAHDPRKVAALPLKSGALQGALALDYTREDRYESVHLVYDGVNGQLPNLDLFNSLVHVAGGQMGIGVSIQDMWHHRNDYRDRLQTMLRGMLRQGIGAGTGAHSCFMPYHVDAVTLVPYGDGWQDEMALGRVVEGTFRSLNNLLEHLHQSFFFYLLMHKEHFVSIGTYLPSAMLLGANFTIMSILMWFKSGQPEEEEEPEGQEAATNSGASVTSESRPVVERELLVPLSVIGTCLFLGAVPLYMFNHLPAGLLYPSFIAFSAINIFLPPIASQLLETLYWPTTQQYQLIKCFYLLVLGMFISSLAILNFSLAFWIGLIATPLTFTRPFPASPALRWAYVALLNIASPPAVFAVACAAWRLDVAEVLQAAAFGWDVWGMYTAVVVWCVWWPAWLAGSLVVLGRPATKVKTA